VKDRYRNVSANRTSARQPDSMDLVHRRSIIQRIDARIYLTGLLEDEGLQECKALSFEGSVSSGSRRSRSSLAMTMLTLRLYKRWEILAH
jgi:hypothetical protein